MFLKVYIGANSKSTQRLSIWNQRCFGKRWILTFEDECVTGEESDQSQHFLQKQNKQRIV